MRIAEGVEVKIGVWDIETLRELFDVGIYNPDTGVWKEYQVSKDKNELIDFLKEYTEDNYDFWVSFNGIGFDHQVVEYILENIENWADLSNLEICNEIYEFVQMHIDNQKYEIPLPYKEWKFKARPLDLFKIHHFDNEARRTSLKWCEFMFDMDVEEMPVHHGQSNLSTDDINITIKYRRHDVLATLGLLYLTLGQLDDVKALMKKEFNLDVTLDALKDYTGKNKIQDRIDVRNETGLDCINWSDVKIGEEWNKLDYKKELDIKDDKLMFSKKIKYPFGKRFKNYFPDTLSFKTDKLKNFFNDLGEEYVKAIKQEFQITIGRTTYTIAKGGLHSTETHRAIIPAPGWRYDDLDVGSQYPNSIVKLNVFPPHLERIILEQYKGKITKRLHYKTEAGRLKAEGKKKEARPYSSVQEMLKLCLNGGYYGKLGQPGSFLEYPEGLLKVCMSNQIEILMLIESMELAGFQVLSGNTDGVTVYYPESRRAEFLKICEEWEKKVGNFDMGKLEETPFSAVWQESINHYIGKKLDGGIKKKGKFLTEFELNKNKSKRVIALALEEYFINKVSPIEFITNHKNIFDFCIAKKASRQLHYEELIGDKAKVHKKLIRYFVSTDGNVFKKRGINNEGDPMDNHCEAVDKDFFWMGQPLLTYFNRYYTSENYNINYSYYILETLKRIDKIEKTDKAKVYANTFKAKQISLF